MAHKLFITRKVVDKHITRIRKHIGAKNMPQMIYLLCDNAHSSLENLVLTKQETKVFLCILEGYSSPEIAEAFTITLSGVEKHRSRILVKNECKTVIQLVLKYLNQQM